MRVICPSCNAGYNIPKEKWPVVKTVAECKRCGGSITIDPCEAVSNGTTAPTSGWHRSDSSTSSLRRQRTPMQTEAADLAKISDEYPEIRAFSNNKFDLPAMLSPTKKGRYKTGKNKYKIRILRAVHDRVVQILNDGEKVMRIGRGTAYYPLELFLGNGWLTMMYNHYAILCTNQRMLFVNINSRINRSTHYLFQMSYSDIKKVKRSTVFHHLILYRRQGKRRIFTAVKGYLGKELRAFVEKMKAASGYTAPEHVSLEKLCPSCFVPLADGLGHCPKCGADFRLPQKAMVRSLMLPGLGDMYLGHRALGALEMLGSVYVWVLVTTCVLAGDTKNFLIAAVLLSFFNGLDGLLTYHMAKKGYMLADPHPVALNAISV